MPVFRFGVRAQPTAGNPKYATWQPADLIAFVVADDGPAAEAKFEAKVKRLHWRILEWKVRDQLIEERIREAGGDVLEAFEFALKRGEWYRIDSEHFMANTMAMNPMSPPRPDESFLDDIVVHAGGRRLTKEERANDEEENADYILNDYVIEAKDIQEERLSKKECHHKIAEIFWPYFEEAAVIPIEPSILSENDRRRYVEILARPIEERIKKARRQVKTTISRLPSASWKGGIILLNSGHCSLSHNVFEKIAANALRKSKYVDLLVCITTRAQTNGFDCYMNWEFSPKHTRTQTEEKIFKSYDFMLHRVMGRWVSTGLRRATPHQPLAEPVSFEYAGKTFVWDPGLAPFSSQQIAGVMSRP